MTKKTSFSFSLLRGWWKLRQTAEGLTLKWSSPSVLRSTHSATSKELKKTQNLMTGLKYSAERNIILDIKYFCRFWCKIWWLWHILWCGGLNGGLLPQITFTTPRHNVPLPPTNLQLHLFGIFRILDILIAFTKNCRSFLILIQDRHCTLCKWKNRKNENWFEMAKTRY